MYLRMYVTEEALKLIQGYDVYADKSIDYRETWELLYRKYGRSVSLMKKVGLKDDLMKSSSIREFDSKRFADFSIKMTNCICLYERKGMLGELHDTEILSKVLDRLPGKLQQRFAKLFFYRQRQNSYVISIDLICFILSRMLLNTPNLKNTPNLSGLKSLFVIDQKGKMA